MRTNRKEVKKWLVDQIDFEGYTTTDGRPFTPKTDNDKVLCAYNIAVVEVGHELTRNERQAMIEHWFSGPCSVVSLPCCYSEIIPLAVKWESLPENFTDKQADKICENWFKYLACQFLQMVDKANKDANK